MNPSDRYWGTEWEPHFDCWSLVRDVYEKDLGIDLPLSGIDPTNLREVVRGIEGTTIKSLFQQIDQPEKWAVAEFRTAGLSSFHVGVCVSTTDGLRLLHLSSSTGLACEPVNQPRLFDIRWWRYVG